MNMAGSFKIVPGNGCWMQWLKPPFCMPISRGVPDSVPVSLLPVQLPYSVHPGGQQMMTGSWVLATQVGDHFEFLTLGFNLAHPWLVSGILGVNQEL